MVENWSQDVIWMWGGKVLDFHQLQVHFDCLFMLLVIYVPINKAYCFCFSVDKDWEDIKFGVENEVDFYAVSFVKDSKVIHELKDYLKSKFWFLLWQGCFSIKFFKCNNSFFSLFFVYRTECWHTCDPKNRKCWLDSKSSVNNFCLRWG